MIVSPLHRDTSWEWHPIHHRDPAHIANGAQGELSSIMPGLCVCRTHNGVSNNFTRACSCAVLSYACALLTSTVKTHMI